MCLRNIFVFVKEAVFGNASIFTPIFAVLILLLIPWMFSRVVRRKKGAVLLFPVALVMILFCFILDFLSGTRVIMRTQFLIAFCIAFLADFLFIRICGVFREKSALLTAAGLHAFRHIKAAGFEDQREAARWGGELRCAQVSAFLPARSAMKEDEIGELEEENLEELGEVVEAAEAESEQGE